MNQYKASELPNSRIDVADILRGIAIGGIVLIHFLEHLNFYAFPEPVNEFWAKIDTAVWDTTFYLLAGKMYAIFATLFGLSFYIQHDNKAQKGIDFRPRFVWRMFLLMLFGLFDLLFYNGDILFLYAVCGLLILPLIRASNTMILILAIIIGLQPIELGYIVAGLIDPSTPILDLGSGACWAGLMDAQANGNILDVAVAGLKWGFPVNFLWATENGRMTQTIFLFMVGILLGRKRLFYNEGNNLVTWKKILIAGVLALAVLIPAHKYLPSTTEVACVRNSLEVMMNMWKNFAMVMVIVSAIVLLYYKTPAQKGLLKIAPYGRMSLTHYLGQSIFGAMLFYNWGFGLYDNCGHTVSFLMGAAFICIQYLFGQWWLKSHKRGPFEELWHKLTYLW